MAELTMADLKPRPGSYQSSRALFDVLIGEDAALPLMEATSSGDNTTLRSLLAQPQWAKIMLEEPHWIYSQERPSVDKSDVRQVSAMSWSNLIRAVIKASDAGHAAVVSTLLNFASQQGLEPSDVITRWALDRAINNNHAAVLEAMAAAFPAIVSSRILGHGRLPLSQAIKRGKPDLVAVLLQLGADPIAQGSTFGYQSSLLSLAAHNKLTGPRITELLLKHGVPVAPSGALLFAAELGAVDTMHLLIQHGADVNEQRTEDNLGPYNRSLYASWTPMHFAASQGKIDAMELLESNGARSVVKDMNGKTPAQLLEQKLLEQGKQ